MATVLTYNELVNQIQNYAERNDQAFIDNIPFFILLAQRNISWDTEILGLQKIIQDTLPANQSVVLKPSRWLNTVSFNIGKPSNTDEKLILEPRSYEYLRKYWPDQNQTDTPLYYSDYDYNSWLIAPTPGDAIPYEVIYFELLEPLDATTQQNWMTERAPQLLLYACMREAETYSKNFQKIQFWEGLYKQALEAVKRQDDMRKVDRGADRRKD